MLDAGLINLYGGGLQETAGISELCIINNPDTSDPNSFLKDHADVLHKPVLLKSELRIIYYKQYKHYPRDASSGDDVGRSPHMRIVSFFIICKEEYNPFFHPMPT